MAKILTEALQNTFPGINQKYIDRALERLQTSPCPENEDGVTWLGKLIVAEILQECK